MLEGWFNNVTRCLVWISTAVFLSACGGGGGDGVGTGGFLGTADSPFRILISTFDAQGNASNTIDAQNPLFVQVRLTDLNNNPVADEAVTLTSSLGSIDPPNGSALTDSDGIARFTVTYNNTVGAGQITANFNSEDGDATATVDVEAFDNPPFLLEVAAFNSSGESTNEFSEGQPLTVRATLFSVSGTQLTPVPNAELGISSTIGTAGPGNGTLLTESNGIASFTIDYSGTSGAGTLQVTFTDADTGTSYEVSLAISALDAPIFLLELRTLDAEGNEVRLFSNNAPLEVEAKLFRVQGQTLDPVANASIAATSTLGTVTPGTGSSLTDATGTARFQIASAGSTGAGTVTVTYETDLGPIERTQTIEAQALAGEYALQLQTFTRSGEASLLLGNEETLSAVATLTSTNPDLPIANQIVTLSSDLASIIPANGSRLTDTNGSAEFELAFNTAIGAGTVTATFLDGDDTITSTVNIETFVAELNRQLSITLLDANGNVTNTLQADAPATVRVAITDDNGIVQDIDGEIISLASDVASVTPSGGASLTTNGVAEFTLNFNGTVGAGTVTATYTTSSGNLTASTNVEALSDEVYTVLMSFSSQLSNVITASNPVTVRVTVLRADTNLPVPNALVTLASDISDTAPANGSLITNGSGFADFALTFSGTDGAGTATATFVAPNGDSFTNSLVVESDVIEQAFVVDIQQPSGATFSNDVPLAVTVSVNSAVPVANAVVNLTSDVGTISPGNSQALTNSSGVASFTLVGDGTTGAGTLTATYTVNEVEFTDSITVQMLSVQEEVNFDLVSLTFVSATPSNIALQGTGGGTNLEERSEVVFQLTDPTGTPVSNQTVKFSLNTTLGGVDLLVDEVTTSATGTATATVISGTVPTPVRVIAETEKTPLDQTEDLVTVFSDVLSVSSGVATAARFNIVAETLNPPDAASISGIEDQISVFAFDRFGNAVPDGTTINFVTECGGIVGTGGGSGSPSGACNTTAGRCSVTWISDPGSNAQCSGGRASILGYVLGEEDFNDNDSNNFFTVLGAGQTYPTGFLPGFTQGDALPSDFVADTWDSASQDLAEPLRNDNDLTTPVQFDADEFFVDGNLDGTWDEETPSADATPVAGPKFNGAACQDDNDDTNGSFNTTYDCFNELVFVSDQVVLVPGPSQSGALIGQLSQGGTNIDRGTTIQIGEFSFSLQTAEGNIPPLGTTVTVTTEDDCSTLGLSTATVPNSNAASPFNFTFNITTDEATYNGTVLVEWSTPNGGPEQFIFPCRGTL